MFYDSEGERVVELTTDAASALGFYGGGKLMIAGGSALSKVTNPYAMAAGYGLMGLGYLTQYGLGGREVAQVVAGVGDVAAENLEKITGVDLNFQRNKAIDNTLSNRNASLLQVADTAVQGQNSILGNTTEGKTIKEGIVTKLNSAQDPDLYTYINKYGSDEQKKEIQRQDSLISTVINPVIK